ncbi:riboflavin biosynthesis protein RibF [Youxingia wuxianensis]|uniref:Riboflavin biosynthesis protein n=1 Tax=Youxingia wuxianensis TaxID=2763678 RepID=A0A926ES55_9FIRM|nr:riboflavin biosynthesis protein RibF [Youxingia wuxianensis]MBC8585514.1 riboflavin biosynthesis protein RibF [Youxingia wuxianensis]
MLVIHELDGQVNCRHTAVALGFFDGLHLGHEAVIRRALSYEGDGICSCVFTFTMSGSHPKSKLGAGELLTEAQKEELLKSWGVRMMLCPEFDEFKEMSPADYVKQVLVDLLHAKWVCCGYDFHFGKGAVAGPEELKELCAPYGISVEVVDAVEMEGRPISSTRIRTLLKEGQVEQANRLLGRAFGYNFKVTKGKQLGRTIDSPTINQCMPANFVALKHGVYTSITKVEKGWLPSVTNVGLRPTVDQDPRVISETYIYGYQGNLYGKQVDVRLLHFLRPEKKYPSVKELKEQIQRDILASLPIAQEYIAKNNEK